MRKRFSFLVFGKTSAAPARYIYIYRAHSRVLTEVFDRVAASLQSVDGDTPFIGEPIEAAQASSISAL